MRILLLSIMAKCGVYTHVKDLAVRLQKVGLKPIIGFVSTEITMTKFGISKQDMEAMEQSLNVPFFYYNSYASLLEKAKENGINIVHAHSPIVLRHAAYIKVHMDVPFVTTLHGIIDWSNHYKTELEMTDKIIAVGPEVANSCGNSFDDKLTIIFNGVDTDYFRPDYARTPDHPLRIIWTGRASGADARGAESLAASLNKLKKMGIPFEAKIMGFAFGANVRNIKHYGWVHDPLPFLQWSDIAFGRGRSLREAMACGNAGMLLAEGYGGLVHSKWFEDGKQPQLSGSLKHGYMELNPERIAEDILFFHKHRDILESIRQESRLIAEKYFDIKKMVDETIKVYEEAGVEL